MATPQQLGDGAAHRVTEDDEPIESDRVGHRGDVVGAILEPERPTWSDAVAVAPVVERQHPEVLGERLVDPEEVEVGRGGPPVEEHQRRRAGRSGDVAQGDGSGGKVDRPAWS